MRWGSRLLMMCLLASLAACTVSETKYLACPGYTDDAGNVLPDTAEPEPDVTEPDTAGQDLTGDTGPALPLATGSACTRNDECVTNSCFCGETVTPDCTDVKSTAEALGATWNYVINGGMCSKLMCNPKGSADQCGDNAFCFDVGPLFGAPMPVGLCVAYCDDYSDCRYLEDYICYFTGIEGQRACLPALIVKDIACGDGKCDAAANETPETCPRDCP